MSLPVTSLKLSGRPNSCLFNVLHRSALGNLPHLRNNQGLFGFSALLGKYAAWRNKPLINFVITGLH